MTGARENRGSKTGLGPPGGKIWILLGNCSPCVTVAADLVEKKHVDFSSLYPRKGQGTVDHN